MKAAKAYFLSRLAREKLLVASFLAIGALVWLFAFGGKATTFWQGFSSRQRTAQNNESIINRRAEVDARSQAAVAMMVPAQTLNSGALYAEVDQLARTAGLANRRMGNVVTTPGADFSVHTVTLQATGITNWEAVNNFYLGLSRRSPYLNLREFTVTATGSPNLVHALSVEVGSVERPRE
jgi:hypothetical protein